MTADVPAAAVLTVMLSWTVMNTVHTLRYADRHYRLKAGGIVFGAEDGQERPSYRDSPMSLHHRHDVPGIRHDAARSPDPGHRAHQ